jgi:hypothetical protein
MRRGGVWVCLHFKLGFNQKLTLYIREGVGRQTNRRQPHETHSRNLVSDTLCSKSAVMLIFPTAVFP